MDPSAPARSIDSLAPWLPASKISTLIQIEPASVILGLALLAYLIYKIALRNVSPRRHGSIRAHFENLSGHLLVFMLFLGMYAGVGELAAPETPLHRIGAYVGLIAIISGATVFVKTARILVMEYFYFGHMKSEFPLILVNIFTLLLSVSIGGWVLTEVFNVRLAPLLATSAIFSLVLGLALQDTLGNLFAGIALQFDKPYEIGDWIEVNANGQKWVGKVVEITWRATLLMALTDEMLTIPNRTLAQAEIANFSAKRIPFVRRLLFRFGFDADLELAKRILIEAALAVKDVERIPAPIAIFEETDESWIPIKLVYSIRRFGDQWRIRDEVEREIFSRLRESGLTLARKQLELHTTAPKSPRSDAPAT